MVLDLRKILIAEKLSSLVSFDYFSSKPWFFSTICHKMKSLKIFKVRVLYFKDNLALKRGINLHKSYFATKIFSRGQQMLNFHKISLLAIQHDPYDSPWPKRIE